MEDHNTDYEPLLEIKHYKSSDDLFTQEYYEAPKSYWYDCPEEDRRDIHFKSGLIKFSLDDPILLDAFLDFIVMLWKSGEVIQAEKDYLCFKFEKEKSLKYPDVLKELTQRLYTQDRRIEIDVILKEMTLPCNDPLSDHDIINVLEHLFSLCVKKELSDKESVRLIEELMEKIGICKWGVLSEEHNERLLEIKKKLGEERKHLIFRAYWRNYW